MFGGLTPFNRRRGDLARRGWEMFDPQGVVESFFNDFFYPHFYQPHYMKADIKENEKEYVVEVEMPGVNKEQVNIELRDDRLTVSVVQNEEIKEESANYIRRERRSGSMSRTFIVEDVDEEKVSAKLKDGVLTIILPKKNGARKNRKIEIE
ncbi:HSP20 family protein [Thermosyntropha lipolytica DSM 11003]|uniref:HSP20 family protein n=1 Tax=Thermosyntropha lipolytica DSM 11003 TaxID=1123382 RepID=A0A1M5NM74_9FIRM|nr:Hsp20/alpha crystallin family protein [Thermosyntropha lipolytica]SHG90666.1 HSP20 family protein [Thermosyntropha lipolytica DSM 11003]